MRSPRASCWCWWYASDIAAKFTADEGSKRKARDAHAEVCALAPERPGLLDQFRPAFNPFQPSVQAIYAARKRGALSVWTADLLFHVAEAGFFFSHVLAQAVSRAAHMAQVLKVDVF